MSFDKQTLVNWCTANKNEHLEIDDFLLRNIFVCHVTVYWYLFLFFISRPNFFLAEDPTTPKTPTLRKQIDKAMTRHKTSSSAIGAGSAGGVSTLKYRTYGVPTVRSDIPAPALR